MEENRGKGRSRRWNGNKDCRKVSGVSWEPPPDRIHFKGGGYNIVGDESWGGEVTAMVSPVHLGFTVNLAQTKKHPRPGGENPPLGTG